MSVQQPPRELQKQLSNLKVKYEQEIKKNNNLLKMNSNLMKENDIYQNCFGLLRGWGTRLLKKNTEDQEEEESCLDIEEEGEQFVRLLMQEVDARMLQLQELKRQLDRLKSDYSTKQLNADENTIQPNPSPCLDCTRWKQLYLKQTKQTSRLQHLITSTEQLKHQKQLNFIKLKDDIKVLLEDYWGLYRERVRMGAEGSGESKREESRRETVRSGGRSKDKRTERSGSKGKKVVSIATQDKVLQGNNSSCNSNNAGNLNSNGISNRTSNNPSNAFSKQKQKTSRPGPKCYSITLPSSKQPQSLPQQLSTSIQSILVSYSQLSTSLQDQNSLLKQQLQEQNQILLIYRQKQRHRMLGR